MRNRIGVLLSVAVLSTVLLATLYVAKFGNPFFGHEGIPGIDISHHQRPRDWESVKQAGTRFVYIKATEGADWTDGGYREHEESARDHGLIVGAYHFFTFCADGKTQAAHFLKRIDLRPGDLPPAVDVEAGGNCTDNPDPDAMRKSLGEFMGAMDQATGSEPILYTTQGFYWKYFPEGFGESRFWIRNLFWCPDDSDRFPLCQYGVSRIEGTAPDRVDRNGFMGGEKAFQRFLYHPVVAH